MSLHTLIRSLIIWPLSLGSVDALAIRVYDPDRHDRFLNFPTAPTHNLQFMHAGFNLTGVGWWTPPGNTDYQFTMVSPMHYIGASHASPGAGNVLRFLSLDNIIRDYTVADRVFIPIDDDTSSDLFIGKFNQPIPSSHGIGFHPYLNLPNESQYLNRAVILLGKPARGASQTTATITDSGINDTRVISMPYTIASGGNDEAYYEQRDSGSPVFIDQNGTAAIIGVNSVLATVTTNPPIGPPVTTGYVNFANFVPHYVDKLNDVMEVDGYRMTKAIPGSTTLTLTHSPPSSVIRAGHAFSLELNLNNTGAIISENVKLINMFPDGSIVTGASGSAWFDESSATETRARRAKIDSGNDTDYTLTLTFPTPGTKVHTVTYSSDQTPLGPSTTQNFNLEVIESFISWTANLVDKSASGDDDMDGVGNLLEYVFGGDPTVPSRQVAGTTVSLLPTYTNTGSGHTFSFVRRKDFTQRAITYSLESSTTLENGSFTDASALINNTQTSSINDDYELVTLSLTLSGDERFFRIDVELNE
ncbi:hypothetical protein NT6N_11580 [Oceaniferula spumae]|uniref:DUF11 domain-containing protein n=1 Tax=Oceaniferula spumae TaxID=2979115 RepID=A0AAT9FJI0_9BACT